MGKDFAADPNCSARSSTAWAIHPAGAVILELFMVGKVIENLQQDPGGKLQQWSWVSKVRLCHLRQRIM